MNRDLEDVFITNFVVSTKQDRYRSLLAGKRRRKILQDLYHWRDAELGAVVSLPGARHSARGVEAELRRRGAGDSCYAISPHSDFDAREFPLREVLDRVVGFGIPVVLCCADGRLAYYEGEGPSDRYILDIGARARSSR